MKVAFISELWGTKRHGGQEYAMASLANEIRKSDYRVDLYSYSGKLSSKIDTRIPDIIKITPYVRDLLAVPFVGRKILSQIDKAYDVIHVSTPNIPSFYKSETPCVITCHNIRSQKFEVFSKIPKYRVLFNPISLLLFKWLESRSLKNFTHIIVIRKHQKDYLIKKFHIPESKISVIPNGVDTDLFRPSASKKHQVIFVGRGTIPKGISTLHSASERIKARVVIATTVINKKFLQQLKQNKKVKLMFYVPHTKLAKMYRESKVFVLPSLDEEQPLTVLEAMASGLPIVTTEVGAADIVVNGVHGYIVAPNDPQNLAERINFLLKKQDLARKIGKQNRKLVLEKHTWENIAARVCNIYNMLVKPQ